MSIQDKVEAVRNDRYADEEEKGKVKEQKINMKIQTTQKCSPMHILYKIDIYIWKMIFHDFLEKVFLVLYFSQQVHSSFTWAFIEWESFLFVCLFACCLFDVEEKTKSGFQDFSPGAILPWYLRWTSRGPEEHWVLRPPGQWWRLGHTQWSLRATQTYWRGFQTELCQVNLYKVMS